MVTIGQIGIGAWGQNLLRSFLLLKNCRVKICCDKNPEILKGVQHRYRTEVLTTQNYDDLLNDSELDAVVIATPAAIHFETAYSAINAGKHVFVEKPLCLDVHDAKRLIEVARKNNRILMVGHLLMHHPAVKKLKEVIASGELGDIYYIYSSRVNLGTVRKEESALWSLTVHDISVALYLLKQKPVEVTAKGAFYLRDKVEDIVFVTISFQNKTIAHVHASWLDPHKIRKFTVVGSKKMAVFDDMETVEKIRIYDKGIDLKRDFKTYAEFLSLRDGDIHIPKIPLIEPLSLECQHFIDSITANKKPLSDAENGLEVLKILTAAQKSLEQNGNPVKIT